MATIQRLVLFFNKKHYLCSIKKIKKGDSMAATDMNYRFLWDTEPTNAHYAGGGRRCA